MAFKTHTVCSPSAPPPSLYPHTLLTSPLWFCCTHIDLLVIPQKCLVLGCLGAFVLGSLIFLEHFPPDICMVPFSSHNTGEVFLKKPVLNYPLPPLLTVPVPFHCIVFLLSTLCHLTYLLIYLFILSLPSRMLAPDDKELFFYCYIPSIRIVHGIYKVHRKAFFEWIYVIEK